MATRRLYGSIYISTYFDITRTPVIKLTMRLNRFQEADICKAPRPHPYPIPIPPNDVSALLPAPFDNAIGAKFTRVKSRYIAYVIPPYIVPRIMR